MNLADSAKRHSCCAAMDITNSDSAGEVVTMPVQSARHAHLSQSDIVNQEVATLVCNIWSCVKLPPYKIRSQSESSHQIGPCLSQQGRFPGTPVHASIKDEQFPTGLSLPHTWYGYC